MTTYATRLQNGTDTAVRMRMADAMMLHSPGLGKVGGRLGIRNDKDAGFVQVSPGTMNVLVSPFTMYLDGGTSDAQGGYPVINDASATLAIAPGDATQARVDLVAVVINDHAFDGSGQTNCTLTIIQGTPGGGVPPLPVTCFPLRAVNVPAGLSAGTGGLSSGNLSTDYRIYLPAGVTRVASSAERDGLAVGAGAVVYRKDTDVIEVTDGTTWRTYKPDTDSGWINLTPTAAAGTGTCQYRTLLGGRLVELRLATSGANIPTGVSAPTEIITAANFPAAIRPSGMPAYGSGQTTGNLEIRLSIGTAGSVVVANPNGGAATAVRCTVVYMVG